MKTLNLGLLPFYVSLHFEIIKAAAIKVHTIGDPTMANYDESTTVTAWLGMYLQQFLTGVTVNNRGKSGSSSKSFYQEAAYWTTVKQQMQNGDYVFIQFSHNDEKTQGMDGDSLIAYYKSIGDTRIGSSYRLSRHHAVWHIQRLSEKIRQWDACGWLHSIVSGTDMPYVFLRFHHQPCRKAWPGDNFSKLTPSGVTKVTVLDRTTTPWTMFIKWNLADEDECSIHRPLDNSNNWTLHQLRRYEMPWTVVWRQR